MNAETPKYILKYYIKEYRDMKPPVLRHACFYNDEDLMESVRGLHYNYFVFEVGKLVKTKEDFDKLFAEQAAEKEKQEFLKLKQKYEG